MGYLEANLLIFHKPDKFEQVRMVLHLQQGNLLNGIGNKTNKEDRGFQFVYIFFLFKNTEFIRGKNGVKFSFSYI